MLVKLAACLERSCNVFVRAVCWAVRGFEKKRCRFVVSEEKEPPGTVCISAER